MKASRYWPHWMFAAVMFTILAVLMVQNYAYLYQSGQLKSWNRLIGYFDGRLMLGCIGICGVMTIICLNRCLPLDTHNYQMRLERENRQFKKVLAHYADGDNYAARALARAGEDTVLPFRERRDV